MGVVLKLERGDALTRRAELLVVKHAQRLYGVDKALVSQMGLATALRLPSPGEHLVIRSPQNLPMDALAFVGVPQLVHFTYPEIRTFGTRALALAAIELPGVREVCMTLHGVTFGLDEVEALRSEVAGIVDAVDAGSSPTTLERVTILELDQRRVNRLQPVLADLDLGSNVSVRAEGGLTSGVSPSIGRPFDSLGTRSSPRPRAFVAMPFAPEYEDRFYFGIAPPIRSAGLICERMDQLKFTGDVIAMTRARIQQASLVIADVSSANPNVYLEIGYAWGTGRPTIVICDQNSEPLFDIRGHRYLRYGSIRELEGKLTAELLGLTVPTLKGT